MSSIFVNIAAYHDYELPKTIDSLMYNSSGKHEIFFGVHYVFENEDNLGIQDYKNIRSISSKAPKNLGAGTGRYIANTLYNNEDYYMVIDSHSRVLPNWDDDLISDVIMYKDLGHSNPVITCYPSSYFYDENNNEVFGKNFGPQNIDFNREESYQNVFKEIINTTNIGIPPTTKYQKSVSGGFTFTVAPYITLNKDIGFTEEFAVGAMLYTNGFDLLIPTKLVIYHYYSAPEKAPFEKYKRRSIWGYDKNKEILGMLLKLSTETNYNMFDKNIVSKNFLGNKRSLKEYAEYSNIDFEKRILL